MIRTIGFSIVYFLCSAVFGNIIFAQTEPLHNNPLKNTLDSAVHTAALFYMQDGTANGLVIGVIKNGKRYIYNYGENRKGSRQLPSADTYFNIGSVAKTFVATLLAQAVVEKKVSLTDDIRKYLPGKYPNLAFHGQAVRMVDLADHTSGLPGAFRDFPVERMDSIKHLSFEEQADFFNRYGKKELLNDLHNIRPDTLPGTKFRYNSTAYSLLIFLLENIYHRSFDLLIRDYLDKHLHMEHTRPVLPATLFKEAAQGYDPHNNAMPYVNLQGYYLGPSMNSTVNDLLTYITAQLSATDAAIRLTHKPLGWMTNNDNGGQYFYHDGNAKSGFNTFCSFYPGMGLGIVIMANDVHDLGKLNQLENRTREGAAKKLQNK